MTIRTITPEEIRKFELIGVTDPSAPTLNLNKWIEDGRTQLELCFVIEQDNQFLGRLIYGYFEEQPLDLKLWHMKIDTDSENFYETGCQLIKRSMEQLASRAYETIEYHLYSTVPDTYEIYKQIFETQGFVIEQEKKNYAVEQLQKSTTAQRLKFKSLSDVGEQAFMDAIEMVTKDTLDRDDQSSIQANGSKEAAFIYYSMLKEIDFNPEWWRIAYNAQHEFVGLVVPQKFDENCGAINYIGVSPEQRGKGFVNDLLLEGSLLLLNDGISQIIADVDVENFPVENALTRLGYEYERSLVILKIKLANEKSK